AVAVAHRGRLFVFGGFTGFPYTFGIPSFGVADASSALFRYEPARDRWSVMPPAPTPRGAFGAAVIGRSLYVAGGVTNGHPADSMEIYDFPSQSWRRGRPMPVPAEHVAGAAVGGAFYVRGGRTTYGVANH